MSEICEAKERPIPYPLSWAVRCPCCDTEMEYDVQEDDSGVFGFDPANWPVCEPCGVMFSPETVEVSVAREVSDTSEVDRLREALMFYANPEIYKPHPHGPAFDRRDLSFHARAALAASEDTTHA